MPSEPENPVTTMDFSWIIRILPFIPNLCTGPICELKGNLITLKTSIDELKDTRKTVHESVDTLEANRMKQTPIVAWWLRRADAMEDEVERILKEGHEDIKDRCLGDFCPWNCCASYGLGKRVDRKIKDVNLHIEKKNMLVPLAVPLPPDPIQDMPVAPTTGMDLMLKKAWDCICEETAGIVGLYGIGGVGKTTLLERIKHEFLHHVAPNDYVVIWVYASSKATTLHLQENVANILGLSFPTNATLDVRASHLYQKLIQIKFALLLDDIWDRVDLRAIGIPQPNAINKSKVVFTTRLESVCGRMNARKVRVECLDWPDAWELFKENVGEETLNSHTDIKEIAMDVAKKCAGLPLALITTGRAMSNRITPEEWNHVLTSLTSSAPEFSTMGDEVYPILKLSYDSLPDYNTQSCFLYCSLFPVDHSIEIDQLIRYWIGEGFLAGFDSMDDARDRGYYIVGTLKQACLLNSSQSSPNEKVLMHDVLRGLALWIGCESGRKRDKYLVRAGGLSHATPEVEKWGEATRISFMNNSIRTLGDTAPTCPALSTLIISGNIYLTNISNVFFQYMEFLRVLDLSGTKICNFPDSIVRLVNLQYLGLARTAIGFIACGILPRFQKLQVLDLTESSFEQWEAKNRGGQDDGNHGASIEELECLNALKFLSIDISNSAALTRLLGSGNFTRCSIQLSLRRCNDLISFPLQTIEIFRNGCLHRLRKVHIFSCATLKDLTWIRGAPDLESLDVRDCGALELIWDDAPMTFARLRSLTLINLPQLKRIPSHLFPSHTIVTTASCPESPKMSTRLSVVFLYEVFLFGFLLGAPADDTRPTSLFPLQPCF